MQPAKSNKVHKLYLWLIAVGVSLPTLPWSKWSVDTLIDTVVLTLAVFFALEIIYLSSEDT